MNSSEQIDHRFKWTRYWKVLSGRGERENSNFEDFGEDNFLYFPKNLFDEVKESQTGVKVLQNLLSSPALILLGRPGSGKSTELDLAMESGLFEDDGCKLIYRRAKEFEGTARSLLDEVDGARSDGLAVRLVLDGADELLMENPKFLNSLEAELRSRLHQTTAPEIKIVISCRAAEWPEGKLSELWPQGGFMLARLCQLDSEAANAFVKAHLGDQTQKFWAEVTKLKIRFLAVWPHSLAGLVEEFRANDGSLPSTLFELVKRTAWRRCDVHHGETDPERQSRLRDRDVAQKWMHRLASRAAALGSFSGRSMLALSPADMNPTTVTADEFLASPEPWPEPAVHALTQADLSDMPRAAIFEKVQAGRLVFAHQLMREFMAASWLDEREVPLPQLEFIFGWRYPDGPWRHYPQLAAIAAWLASHPHQRNWRKFLTENDPAVLLRADAASLPPEEKKEIVSALLQCAVRERAVDPGWQHRQLQSLACEGLSAILQPYLLNFKGEYEAARDLAIDIAREADVRDSVPDLWKAIRHTNVKLRPDMAYTLSEIAVEGYDAEWMQVLDGTIPLDNEGALLGAALKVMVPKKLQVRDVLRHLIPKHNFGFIGLYDRVHRNMVEFVEKADALPIVRHSSANFAAGFGDSWDSDKRSLLSMALIWLSEDFDKPEALEALVEWWSSAVQYSRTKPAWTETNPTLAQLGFENAERRHSMLEFALNHPKLKDFKEEYFWNAFRDFVRFPEDIDWLIAGLHFEDSRQQRVYAGFLRTAIYRCSNDVAQKRKLTQAYESNLALQSILPISNVGKTIFEDIESKRENYRAEDEKQGEQYKLEEQKRDQEYQEGIAACFKEARALYDSSNWKSWDWLINAFFHKKRREGGDLNLADIKTATFGPESWMLDSPRRWLLHPAPAFPATYDGKPADFGVPTTWALYVLWNQLEEDKELMASVRKGWLPHVLNFMLRHSWSREDFTIVHCLSRFGSEATDALMTLLSHEYATNGEMWSMSYLDTVAVQAVPKMMHLLTSMPPQPKGIQRALEWMATHDLNAAEEVANHLLDQIPVDRVDEPAIALDAAILVHLNGRLWERVKPRVWSHRETASKVLRTGFWRIGFHLEEKLNLEAWPSDYLTDIAELMTTTFPPESDPGCLSGPVTARQEVTEARNWLINSLANRGMTNAVRRLESLNLAGTDRWFRQLHLRASNADHAQRWQRVQPADMLALAGDHDLRLVHNEDDLLRALLLALTEYEHELRVTSHGKDLRNDDGSPRLEEFLSDHLAQWLREHLKVHRIRENQTIESKREDITVMLNLPGKEPLSVCIEVKKNDSAELLEKMETQLLELYLKAQKDRTHGVYTVFWYDDGESSAHPEIATAEQLADYLDKQAKRLSVPPYSVSCKVLDCRRKIRSKSNLDSGIKKPVVRRKRTKRLQSS